MRPAQSGRRYFPGRDAGVTGLQSVGLRSRAIKDDLKLWTAILGAKVTDRVGEVTYLSIDQKHHRVVLYPSEKAGLVYVAYGVESMDAVMQNNYFVQERQIKIVQGPGREPTSGQIFLRFAGPDGYVFSYGYGLKDIDFTSSSATVHAGDFLVLRMGERMRRCRRIAAGAGQMNPSYAQESKMIELKDLSYVRLGASSLDDAENFATRCLGLQIGEQSEKGSLSPVG